MRIEFAPINNVHDRPVAVLVLVKHHALRDDDLIRQLEAIADFRGLHVILCSQGPSGQLDVYGDQRIVSQLRSHINGWEFLPWMTAELN